MMQTERKRKKRRRTRNKVLQRRYKPIIIKK